MDMEEPSLMDVVHDTINSTRRSGSERSCLLSVGRRCQILKVESRSA